MSIYDRPTKALMHDFARERLKPGQIFEKRDAVAWFKEKYPRIKSATVQMHVEGMAVNATARKHHPNIKPGAAFDFFWKVGPGKFRLWDHTSDPAPIYLKDILAAEEPGNENPAEATEAVTGPEDEDGADRAFAFERDLRNYLERNLGLLEEGLSIYRDEDGEFTGVEYPVGGRFIDILAVDREGEFIVIELKVSRGYDRTIGQILRYMAWVSKNLASGRPVRGIIVANEITEDLRLAASMVSAVQLVEYEIAFRLKPIEMGRKA